MLFLSFSDTNNNILPILITIVLQQILPQHKWISIKGFTMKYYKHTALGWGCYGGLSLEEKIITRDVVEGDNFLSESDNPP